MARQRRKHHFWRNLLVLIVLFGVFGISTYLLAPALVYLAILVAMGRPAKLKMAATRMARISRAGIKIFKKCFMPMLQSIQIQLIILPVTKSVKFYVNLAHGIAAGRGA